MKNKIIIIGLLLVILLSFGFITLRLAAAGPKDNWFNSELRSEFAKSPFLRSWIDLRWDGGAKADYLGKRYSTIVVSIYTMEGNEPDQQALSEFVEQLESLTEKSAVLRVKPAVSYKSEVDPVELAKLYSLSEVSPWRSTAELDVIYASKSVGEDDLLGKTYGAYGIVIYKQAIREFSGIIPKTLSDYEQSTLLHEFGHQLGVPHNTQSGCLMTEHAEVDHSPRRAGEDVVKGFCQLEQQQLELLKREFN